MSVSNSALAPKHTYFLITLLNQARAKTSRLEPPFLISFVSSLNKLTPFCTLVFLLVEREVPITKW